MPAQVHKLDAGGRQRHVERASQPADAIECQLLLNVQYVTLFHSEHPYGLGDALAEFGRVAAWIEAPQFPPPRDLTDGWRPPRRPIPRLRFR